MQVLERPTFDSRESKEISKGRYRKVLYLFSPVATSGAQSTNLSRSTSVDIASRHSAVFSKMRGDKLGGRSAKTQEAIDAYLHTHYEDIEDLYLENIYKLGI